MRLDRDEEITRQVEIMRAMQVAKERKARLQARGREVTDEERLWRLEREEEEREDREEREEVVAMRVELARAQREAEVRRERLRMRAVEAARKVVYF
jgi:hypothetical protein